MVLREKLILEFDKERRIVHFSAASVIKFADEADIDELYLTACEILDEFAADGPCCILVDISKFILEPSIFEYYYQRSLPFKEKYLFPGGLAGYGYEITRVTILMGYANLGLTPPIFKTRHEATAYLESVQTNQVST
jgi:hypothetical protein